MNNLLYANCATTRISIPVFDYTFKLNQIFKCFDMKRKTIPDLWSIHFQTFSPKVTWFHSGVSKFNLYCSLLNRLLSLTLKMKTLYLGYLLFYKFQHTNFSTYLHSFLHFLLFLINLHKILSNDFIKIEALFFEEFQFCSGIQQQKISRPENNN